jgi:hypothetical protein
MMMMMITTTMMITTLAMSYDDDNNGNDNDNDDDDDSDDDKNMEIDADHSVLMFPGPIKESTAKRMASELGLLGYWETSALLDQGVTELFQAATRAALRPRSRGMKKGDKHWSRRVIKSCLQKVGIRKNS